MMYVNLDKLLKNVKIFSENGEIIETWLDLPTEDKVSCLPTRIKLYLSVLNF